MVNLSWLVRLEAKPGKEAELENFIKNGLGIVHDEPTTISWYGLRLGPSTFGVFDTFQNEAVQDKIVAHGKISAVFGNVRSGWT